MSSHTSTQNLFTILCEFYIFYDSITSMVEFNILVNSFVITQLFKFMLSQNYCEVIMSLANTLAPKPEGTYENQINLYSNN